MSKGNDNGVEHLAEVVAELTDQVRVLINAVDELREEIGWGNRNSSADDCRLPQPFRLTSMSRDPTADDFRLNQVDQSTIEQLLREACGDKSATAPPGRLF